jgi:hypothetical protein
MTDQQQLYFLKMTLLMKMEVEVVEVCETFHHLIGLSLGQLQMCSQKVDSYQYL